VGDALMVDRKFYRAKFYRAKFYRVKQAGRDRMVASVAFREDAGSGSKTERRLQP